MKHTITKALTTAQLTFESLEELKMFAAILSIGSSPDDERIIQKISAKFSDNGEEISLQKWNKMTNNLYYDLLGEL